MNKKMEILRLTTLAHSLGNDSYLGPWLESVIGEVESNIKSDIFPSILPSETARQCQEMLANAVEKEKQILMMANAEGEKIVKNARETASYIVARVKRNLADAEKELVKY